jgi:hypothetical protein
LSTKQQSRNYFINFRYFLEVGTNYHWKNLLQWKCLCNNNHCHFTSRQRWTKLHFFLKPRIFFTYVVWKGRSKWFGNLNLKKWVLLSLTPISEYLWQAQQGKLRYQIYPSWASHCRWVVFNGICFENVKLCQAVIKLLSTKIAINLA